VLNLAAPTSPDWASRAISSLDVILLDHAHCEKKAASTALGLVFRYTHHGALVRPLSELAREELRHFELMLDVLSARSIPFIRLRPSAYAGRLMAEVRPREPDRLLDTLLCCALIEARSCERMRLLSEGLEERGDDLARVYRGLLASEARHHTTYVDLAGAIVGVDVTRERLRQLAQHEASLFLPDPAHPSPPIRLHS